MNRRNSYNTAVTGEQARTGDINRLPTQRSAPSRESRESYQEYATRGGRGIGKDVPGSTHSDRPQRVGDGTIEGECTIVDRPPTGKIAKWCGAWVVAASLLVGSLSFKAAYMSDEAGAASQKASVVDAESPGVGDSVDSFGEAVVCAGDCTISDKGLGLILDFEGFRPESYQDSGGKWTIGYGTTAINGEPVTANTSPISEPDARALAQEQINNNYGAAVNEAFAGVTLTQNQYDALTSLTYNVGTKWLTGSKLLDLIKANPNDPAVGDAMKEYRHAKGKVLQGLVNRRAAEASLYFTPVIVEKTKYAANNVEIFDQTDPMWKDAPFGTSTVGKSGCAPSALAMVINAMTDNRVTPDEVAAFADDNGQYAPGEGAYRTIPDVVLPNWGLKSKKINMTVDNVNQVLNDGGMVIVSGKDDDPDVPFTERGHYVAIRGYAIDSEGNTWWLILDSAPGPDHNSWSLWNPDGIVKHANKEPGGKNSVRAVTVKE